MTGVSGIAETAIVFCGRKCPPKSDAQKTPPSLSLRGASVRRRLAASLSVFLTVAPLAAVAGQAREVTGKVTQAGVATPITEATIGILGAQLGVRTNERGEYRVR